MQKNLVLVSVVAFGGCAQSTSSTQVEDSTSTTEQSLCQGTSESTLDGVQIVFDDQPCVFTLEQATAGITLSYAVEVTEEPQAITYGQPGWNNCLLPGDSGLAITEELAGGSEYYCMCDFGRCPDGERPTELTIGSFSREFVWDGVNWTGPSDFSNPKGEPFPPGEYTLTVSANGNVVHGRMRYLVEASWPVRLVETLPED